MRMVRWCIRLTRLTLVCKVIRYRLVQVRQNHKKKKKKRYRTCCSLRTSLQLQLHHDQHQGLRCVRCYARRLGDSRRNAHAKAQAALEPGLRQTSHAIVWPLRPPFLSFSLPPTAPHQCSCSAKSSATGLCAPHVGMVYVRRTPAANACLWVKKQNH